MHTYPPGTLGHVFDSNPPARNAEKFPAENGPSECKVPNFGGIKKGVFPDFTQTAKGAEIADGRPSPAVVMAQRYHGFFHNPEPTADY